MNTIDLINMLAVKHNITTGRAEMIMSIIVEKIVEKLKKEGNIGITSFGSFKIQQKQAEVTSYLKMNEPIPLARNLVTFEPDKSFIEAINAK
jgi:nucleoid DNA-binding protein